MCGEFSLFDVTLILESCMICDILRWREGLILCSTNTKYCCYNKQTCHTQVIVSFSICSNICPLHSLLLDVSLLSVWKSVCAPRCCATWNQNLGPRYGLCESILCSVSFEIYAIRRPCSHALALNEHEAFPSQTVHLHTVALGLDCSGGLVS